MTGCHPISRAAFVFRTPRQSVLRSLNISLSTGNLGTSSCLHLQGTRLQACLIRYPPPPHWTLDDQAEPHTIFSISQRETSVGYLMLPASSNQAYSVFDFSHVFSILPVAFWRTHTLSLARSLSRSLGLYARSVSGFDMQLLPCCVGRSFHTQVGVWQGAVHTHLIFPSSSCARMALC